MGHIVEDENGDFVVGGYISPYTCECYDHERPKILMKRKRPKLPAKVQEAVDKLTDENNQIEEYLDYELSKFGL